MEGEVAKNDGSGCAGGDSRRLRDKRHKRLVGVASAGVEEDMREMDCWREDTGAV